MERTCGLLGTYGLPDGQLLDSKRQPKSAEIVDLMRRTFEFVASFEGEIPGAAPKDCGNYLLHDLPMARWESRKYVDEVLNKITEDNLIYPFREE